MKHTALHSKIHRATVTESNLNYEGSITVDRTLLELANIYEFESVDIYNINNGSRLTTYIISGEPGSGIICVNGAAARHFQVGDLIIIASYVLLESAEFENHKPRNVFVNASNRLFE